MPADDSLAPYMTGIEILDGEEVYFRGGVTEEPHGFWLIDEDGVYSAVSITAVMGDGTQVDMDGNVIDPLEPTPHTIVSLLRGPELEHKGQWGIYLTTIVASAFLALSILFADELFYLSLAFRVRDAEYAEPSDWELTSRTISWTILAGAILVGHLLGLQ